MSPRWPLRWLAVACIRVFQGMPPLLQLFLVFFGSDLLRIGLGACVSAILGLSFDAGGSGRSPSSAPWR